MAANPYVEARREWDERYADLVLGKRNWQLAAAGSLTVALILAAGIVWLATRSRYIPYIVEVDKLGYALTIPQPLTAAVVPDVMARMERYEIAAFIRNARSVSSDPQVEQQQLNALLAHARGAADRFLDAYYHADGFTHNPFKLAEKQTIAVQIDSILRLSDHSYQVRWTETARDLNGVNLGAPLHWETQLQTQRIPPASSDTIVSNPLGLYVTQISWTQQAQ
jgi:type IV secretion system protein TrbF